MKIVKSDLIYRNPAENYTKESVNKRVEEIENKTGKKYPHIKNHSLDVEHLTGNIENFIGVTQVPLGIAGPLLVNGDYAKGLFYVPMATTEGSLVDSYTRAMLVSSLAGGIKTKILNDVMHIIPAFYCNSIEQALSLKEWIEGNFQEIKEKAEETTQHGKLIRIECKIFSRELFVRFMFTTGDAMGMNMVNISANNACKYISEKFNLRYILRSNLCSDKKVSFYNNINGYGKTTYAEIVMPDSVVKRYFKTDARTIVEGWKIANYAQMIGGAIGLNQHFANGLSAIFIATGQDVAQVVNGASGYTISQVTKDHELFASVTIPNLLIGTIGGGTKVGCQKEALEIMDCYGNGKSKKLAEIITAAILAGEISLGAALAHGDFISAHTKKNIEIKKDL